LSVPLGAGIPATERTWLMLRPERLRVLPANGKADVSFDAVCFNSYLLGSRTHLHAKRDERTFISELDAGMPPPEPGSPIRLGFDWSDAVAIHEGGRLMKREQKAGLILMSPPVLLLIAGFLLPLAFVAYTSLMPPRTFGLTSHITFENYVTAV